MSQSKSNPSYAAGWRWGWGLLALLALMVLVYAYNRSFPNKPVGRNKSKSTPPLELRFASQAEPKVERPPLAGPDRCATCHREIYQGYRKTNHAKTCRELVESEVPNGFTKGKNQFQSPHANVAFEMIQQGKNYFQTAISKTPRGEQRTTSRIDLVLGAGGVADDVFLSWHDDGSMRELPMVWLYPLNSWSTSHFDPNSGGDYSRALTIRCFECHNTWAKHVPGTLNQYEREGHLLGVTCESCHGPAAPHVDYHLQNPNTKTAMHVVRPSKLERERQIEVCTQCHSNAMKHLGTAFQFRPGNVLSDHYKTIETTANEEDRVANQITYLRQSKCFQNSEMTCTTCHNPHQPKSAVSSGSVHCAKCHQPSDCKDAVHLPELVRTDCVSCHMPSYLKINVNFETEQDNFVPPLRRIEHRIAVHPQARHETLWKHFASQSDEASQAEAKKHQKWLVDYYQQESVKCNKEYRFLAAIAARREVVRFEDNEEHRGALRRAVELQTRLEVSATTAQRQLLDNDVAGAMATFESILATKPNDSKTHGRLGTEYAKLGNNKKAFEHLIEVARHDPNDVYGVAMLGWLSYLGQRDSEALMYYEQAEKIEPREAKLFYQKGLVLARMQRLPDAMAAFQKAIEIEPNRPDAIQAFIAVALETQQAERALPIAERVVKMTESKDVQALMMLAEVYKQANMRKEALQAHRLALELAPSQDPASTARIMRAIKELEQ